MTIHLIAAGRLEDPNLWPEVWHHCYNIWKDSPYEMKLWGNEEIDNLVKEDDEEFFNILDTLPPIYKWDYVRYIILEMFGGAYFDMDVEIKRDFFSLLNPNLPYLMEGTGGTLVENSIMIDSMNCPINKAFWNRFKMFTKRKVLENLKECQIAYNVLHYAGPWMMTELLIKNFDKDVDYCLLGYEQFGNPNSFLSFSKHYQDSHWHKECLEYYKTPHEL